MFLRPTSKEEINNIISSLNSNKVSGPNSMPDRILFLLKNWISKQLADLLNLSFVTSIFPLVLKTPKVVPIFKKNSKLDYNNYHPISLLSNNERILENLCIKDCIPSSITTILSMTINISICFIFRKEARISMKQISKFEAFY